MGADFVIAVNLSADFRPRQIENCEKEHEASQKKTDELLDKVSNGFIKKWFSPDVGEDKNSALGKRPAPGIVSVMSSSLEILQARVTRSRLAGEPPDILIEPQLRDVGILEFHRAIEVGEKGKQAVQRLAQQIAYQLNIVEHEN
jgi:NTE family protein